MLVDSVVVLGLVGLGCYVLFRVLAAAARPRTLSGSGSGSMAGSVSSPGVWRTHHYDAKGVTRVVVQKLSPAGTNLLNEHVVTTIPLADPEYDAKFLAAMATARERRAMFESEDDS